MGFYAGQYTCTLASSSSGQLKQGIKIGHQVYKQKITGDNFAKSRQDSVFQGMDVYSTLTLLDYGAAAARALFWPYGSSYLTMGTVGRLDSAVFTSMVLTAIAGTSASTSPATITLPLTGLAEGFPVEILFAPELREIPLRLEHLPNSSGVFGTLT